jgi:hypothetical protein
VEHLSPLTSLLSLGLCAEGTRSDTVCWKRGGAVVQTYILVDLGSPSIIMSCRLLKPLHPLFNSSLLCLSAESESYEPVHQACVVMDLTGNWNDSI